ncbi:MAG: cytochrome c [Limisphaerales bacterium]
MKPTALLTTVAFIAFSLPALGADPTVVSNYNRHCASCHGKDGTGGTTMGKKLGVKNLTQPKVVADIQDDVALKNLKEGVKDKNGKEIKKPFAAKLTEAEMKALIEYCKAFAKH